MVTLKHTSDFQMQFFYSVILLMLTTVTDKSACSYDIRHTQQTIKCHIISGSNKLFYMRCLKIAKKKSKEKTDQSATYFPTVD